MHFLGSDADVICSFQCSIIALRSYAKSLYCELGCGNLCSAQKNSLRAQVGTLIQC